MRATVVIRSKDEAFRLRLALESLMAQTEQAEVVVVNDGSSDATADVMAEAEPRLDLVAIHHRKVQGRSSAANAGAAAARGDILIFLDGDTLASPDLVAKHLAVHEAETNCIARGETWHLRRVRDLLDPATGTPMPGREAQVERMPRAELTRARITPEMIRDGFAEIERQARPGIYAGFGPGRLMELEMDALRTEPNCAVLWAAASGNNMSVRREAFLQVGGFHPQITINEHRELALRLCEQGSRMTAVGTRTFHLTHRSGWRDPLLETDWEALFYDAHPLPAVALLPFLWASLSEVSPFPAEALIHSLPELAQTADRYRGITGLKSVRDAHLRASMGR